MAGGRAFTFRYPETEELLRAAGCEVVTFDPIADTSLPARTQGIYLGGGFPEVYAAELAANRALLHDLRLAVEAGIPTVAECAGLLYLAESLDGAPMAGVVPASAAMSERLTLRYPAATAVGETLLTRPGEQVTGHEFHRTTMNPATGDAAAWEIDGSTTGFATDSLHASYLHVHWAGHPQLAQRFADAAHTATPHLSSSDSSLTEEIAALSAPTTGGPSNAPRRPLRHHGDAETRPGLLDFAVNVYDGPRPEWLDRALRASLANATAYPDASSARTAIARRHSRKNHEVLPTAGAAEAFTLIARLRPWRRPVVVHPQFTEPHAALEQAGQQVTSVVCKPENGFSLDPGDVPEDADLIVIGNPTNPTGVLHPAALLKKLRRNGRMVVVDEAFMDAVPGESESLVRESLAGVVVLRSLTKHWSIPGIRAGYVVGDSLIVRQMADLQTPWSVSTPAIASLTACMRRRATPETRRRAHELQQWGDFLQGGLRGRGIEFVPSVAPYVLARLGEGAHEALREGGIAVRRADTFPGLDSTWVRIAARPQQTTLRLFAALDHLPAAQSA
jgi:cobyrinic acid a,c-diamide synthase